VRPLALTLEGLRSFRSPVTIDFTGRDHVAIIGDTGAGKSSLLEAMTWALYGRTSWSGQPNQELVNDTSPGGRVVLRFRVRGQTWQVTRALRRRGDGTIGPAKVALAHLDDDDLPVERVEGVAAVRNRVEELLGLDDKAFTRTVVLPQGQFAQLLLGEGDVPRADILRQVWRLDELEAGGRPGRRPGPRTSSRRRAPVSRRRSKVRPTIPCGISRNSGSLPTGCRPRRKPPPMSSPPSTGPRGSCAGHGRPSSSSTGSASTSSTTRAPTGRRRPRSPPRRTGWPGRAATSSKSARTSPGGSSASRPTTTA
jgi:exonuclease SbcC